jgi:3-hydroxy-9,10-secoandrosta-1,3,5(10)-triene-9,17-dione monooxygenase reductase component
VSDAADARRRFRDTIGRFATGVAVVTAAGPDGPAGMTTNAVSSLSLEPVLLLVCFESSSRTLPVVRETGRFAVNVLAAGQEELARTFASKRVPAEKFAGAAHREARGLPVLDGALAWLACDLRALHPGGDHVIAVGEVGEMGAREDGEPLLWVGGGYATHGGPTR